MKTVLNENVNVPKPPENIKAHVSSGNRVTIEFNSQQSESKCVILKFKSYFFNAIKILIYFFS